MTVTVRTWPVTVSNEVTGVGVHVDEVDLDGVDDAVPGGSVVASAVVRVVDWASLAWICEALITGYVISSK